MKDICEHLKSINDTMEAFGFRNKVSLGNDYVTISEDKVTIRIPYEITITSTKKDLDEKGFSEAVKEAFNKVFQKRKDKMKNLWWGYLHNNATIQAKRYFDKQDIDEASDSTFVQLYHGPFEAEDREDALRILEKEFSA